VPALDLDPRIRRTRQMLFEALRQLLLEKSFEAISVQDIAERSTVNRATFYDHFTDKFALLEEMIGEQFRSKFEARMAGTAGTCREAQKQLILVVCDYMQDVSSGCQKHQRQFEPVMEDRVKAVLREYLLAGFTKHGTPVPDAELRATLASWAIYGAAWQWNRTKTTTAEELAATVLPLVLPALEV
jgi:AcrR family transcriptional regulator